LSYNVGAVIDGDHQNIKMNYERNMSSAQAISLQYSVSLEQAMLLMLLETIAPKSNKRHYEWEPTEVVIDAIKKLRGTCASPSDVLIEAGYPQSIARGIASRSLGSYLRRQAMVTRKSGGKTLFRIPSNWTPYVD
jgi:hypothetical protein